MQGQVHSLKERQAWLKKWGWWRCFLLTAPWPSKSPQLHYWESNLLNFFPSLTSSLVNWFLSEVGIHTILEDGAEISEIQPSFAAFCLFLDEKKHWVCNTFNTQGSLARQCAFEPPPTGACISSHHFGGTGRVSSWFWHLVGVNKEERRCAMLGL